MESIRLKKSLIGTETKEPENERDKWDSKWDYILSVLGGFVGTGNIWRFPFLCYKHGGGAFLVPYGLFLILVGIPLFYLEESLGQLTQAGGIEAWNIVPQWWGLGYATIYIDFFVVVYFNVIIAWTVYYFVASFTSGNSILANPEKALFPWSTCGNSWNTECCVEGNVTTRLIDDGFCSQNGTQVFIQPTVEFWENSVLQASSGIDDGFFTINWNLFFCLVVSWILVFLCTFKGVKWTGKVAWFTATVRLNFLARLRNLVIFEVLFGQNIDFSKLHFRLVL